MALATKQTLALGDRVFISLDLELCALNAINGALCCYEVCLGLIDEIYACGEARGVWGNCNCR